MNAPRRPIVGRASPIEPANRFESLSREADYEHLDDEEVLATERRVVPTQFLPDTSRSIVSENDSPDIPFRYSVNPYRGCEHGWVCSSILPPCNLGKKTAFRPRDIAAIRPS